MKGPLLPVSRDRRISDFPKCYTPEACLQLREDFQAQGEAHLWVTGIEKHCMKVQRWVLLFLLRMGEELTRHRWDTAGQEKFKCIASAYYRGAEVIITVFDLADIQTLDHTKRWLEDALRENHPGSSFVFLVGTKKDLLVSLKKSVSRTKMAGWESICSTANGACVKRGLESNAESERTERDAVRLANEMQAEYWSVSAKTGENVKDFFFRVAALAFERDRRKRSVFTQIQPELLLMAPRETL
ncbi:hypothetical protein E2320_012782 [Naja naja]|nr:hypothetical protein E2320_012782 [Naja naja]